MAGSLNDKMGVWRGSRLCPWRRALHLYVLYTTYLVTFIGQCQTNSLPKKTTTTYSTTQEPISRYNCTTCRETDTQQQACSRVKSCYGTLNCSKAYQRCSLQCNNTYFERTVWLRIEIEEKCNVICDRIEGPTLQFEKPDSLTWSGVLSITHFVVKCSLLYTTMCSCCRPGNGCCDDLWNCIITPLENPTSSSTTSTKASTTSSRGTTLPNTTTTKPRSTTTTTTTTKPRSTTTTTKPRSTTTTTTTTTKPRSTTTTTTKPRSTTTTTTTKPRSTTTTATKRTSTVSTSEIGSSNPEVSTASPLPVTEGRSTASQTAIDYVPTIAVLASLLVLSIIVIGIIVVIVLRRNRRKKEAENSDFIISNTSYVDVTQHHKPHPGLSNPRSSRELPAKSEDDEEHTYCYPSFDDSKQNVDTESQQLNIQDLPIKTMTYSTNSYSQKHGNNCKMNQAIVTEQSVEKDTGHPNETLDSPSNYFVLEKSKSIDDTNGPATGDSANYFVLETTSEDEPRVNRNQEGEMTETGETSSETTGENYFLVDKPDVGTISDNRSNENYFVLDKNTDDSKPTETQCNDGLQTSDNTRTGSKPQAKDTPTTTADPYDHVRIGHAHTNGFDDGVYDELRKQNVRYEAEGVENDYDHC